MSLRGFPRIFGYDLRAIKYLISVPLDRGDFGGWNLLLTGVRTLITLHHGCKTKNESFTSCRGPVNISVGSKIA